MSLLDDLEALRSAASAAFASAADPAALETARIEFLGTRGKLKAALGRMGEVPKEQKPAVGKRANEIGREIEAFFEQARERIGRGGTGGQATSGTHGQGDGAAAGGSGTHMESHSSWEQLKAERLRKLELYEAKMGAGSAWGARFPERTSGKALSSVEAIRKLFAGLKPEQHADAQASQHEVCLAARVTLRRDQSKKLIFLTVQDQSGSIQVGLWNALLNDESLALLRDTLDLWDIVGITGKLAFTQKGEPTVWATSARILSKCILPPPDKHHGIHDKEIRYRQRYLDLISEEQSRQTFILRAKAISGVRRFLDEQGFLEMETPILQTIPGGAAARPFETHLNSLNMKMYLRIATEIPLKKLLVGGLEKVYDLGRIFRNEGLSPKHNPEFTTVEIYQSYGDLRDMMALTENLVSGLAEKLTGSTTVTFRGKPVKLGAPWPRLDYCELLQKHAGVSHEDVPGLEKKIRELGLDPSGLSHVDKIDTVFGEICEPHLQDACFVINQPLEMSPLCKAHPDNPKLADRFEAFASSMEIANAYTELNEPIEQRKRLEEQADQAIRAAFEEAKTLSRLKLKGFVSVEEMIPAAELKNPRLSLIEHWASFNVNALKEALPESAPFRNAAITALDKIGSAEIRIDEDFLCALEHGMPPAGGLGIGIDRVVMLLAGVDSIRDVILFPLMRPEGGGVEKAAQA